VDPFDYNGTHCVQAFELRRRGTPVQATALPAELLPGPGGGGGRPLADIEAAWGVRFTVQAPDLVAAAFRRYGPGARGFVAVLWRFGGGHVFSVENVAGRVRFVDPQTGEADVGWYFELAEWAAYVRVDEATAGPALREFAEPEGAEPEGAAP